MELNSRVRVKICCIASVEEARLAVAQGAAAVGLVSRMPSGPGVIAEELIAAIAATMPPGVGSFLLTSETDVQAIVGQQRRTRVNTLQLVDALPRGAHQELRNALPGIALVQAVHVLGEESIAEASAVAPHVDAILLDSGNPTLAVKELGGTGRVHDWAIGRQIRETDGSSSRFSCGRAPSPERRPGHSPSRALRLGCMQRRAHQRQARPSEVARFLRGGGRFLRHAVIAPELGHFRPLCSMYRW